MAEQIAQIILIGSLGGMIYMFLIKMPSVAKLPADSLIGNRLTFSALGKGLKNIPLFKDVSFYNILKKILLKIKILALKAENQTSSLLEKLHQKSQAAEKTKTKSDNYWKEIRKAKDGK
ncbi:MAG: hypothetical protein Q7T34_00780 [Candidatus Parcubacteria bacterium]|nr:hypothetical protein [Candidatus Parcubacteria bacterium]